MVEIGSQKMQNVASQDCRSVGSPQFPSGRFPKVSIGIPFDHKTGSKEDVAVLPSVRQTSSCQGAQRTTRTELAETLEGNQSEAVGQKAAWFSTKYVHLETPAAETVQFYVNQASVLHSEDGMHKTLDTVAYGKRRQKGGDVQRVEEVAYASVQKTQFLDKAIGREESEKIARHGTEGLKLKLWEILGTAPSQNRHNLDSPFLEEDKEDIDKDQDLVKPKGKVATSNVTQPNPQENRGNTNTVRSKGSQKKKIVRSKSTSPNFEDNKENININKSKKHQKGKVTRIKQDSDTIENDSGSANQVSRRPITRSSTRKRAPPNTANKIQGNSDHGKKPLSSSSSGFKLKLEKNIFAFDEGEGIAGTLNRTASGHSSRSKEKINRKKATIEPRKIYFDRSSSDKSLHCNHREQMSLSPDKNSPYRMEKEASPLPSQRKKQVMQKDDSHYSQKDVENHFSTPKFSYNTAPTRNADSPLFKRKKFSWDNDISPPLPENDVLHKKDVSPSMLSEPEPFDDLQTPMFAMNMCPTSTAVPPNEILCNTEASKLAREVQGLKDADKSSRGSSQSDTNTESTDATLGIHKSQDTESLHTKDESEKPLSLSSNEEQNTEREADDCKGRDSEVHDEVPNIKTSKNSPFSLHLTRRSCNLNKLRKSKLSSMSPLGTSRTEETIGSLDVSEQLPEDSLARSIAKLAMVLQRFRAGLKMQTRKRSSEVLSESADKIRLQLQDAESRILTDMGKFASAGKSKRKRLESEFQEQQERLTVIHNKYKEEVNRHIMDCRRTLEKFEACHVELKGTADRQKASHRKLLLQVEEAMEAQISDAETIIDAIRKEARKKMSGLKCVLRECV